MGRPDTNDPASPADIVALQALAWTLGEPERARRLIDLTGLDPDALRARAGEPAVLVAVLGFLEANEADLIACADDLGIRPEALVRVRSQLENAA